MSDDEVIRFEITDYDLDNEFNIRGKRATKEQQIYGVWAKESDDDDDESNVRHKGRKAKDYSAPIGFVAGGVQQAGKKKAKQQNELQASEEQSSAALITDSSDSDGGGSSSMAETAGLRPVTANRTVNLGGNVGHWERHTKGIGAKLLLKMGYQPGRGLGKDLQGISAPVEATLRKGRGAIGAYGPEKSTQKAKKEEEKRLKEKELEEQPAEKSHHWKKSHKGRYFYKDSADVIQEGKPTMHTLASNSLSRVPVIDMTGRERRVLSGYAALAARAPRFEHQPRRNLQHFTATELMHNIELCVDLCEQDIIMNARELQNAEDEMVVLERDLQQCNLQISEHDVYIETMKVFIEKIEELNKIDISLEDSFEVLEYLKNRYPLEYEMFSVGAAGGTVISALLSALTWNILVEPREILHHLLRAKTLMDNSTFNTLLYNSVMRKFEMAACEWNPRDPSPMLLAYNMFVECEPSIISLNAISKCIVQRIEVAVHEWDPTKDTQPIHEWVLPWHHYVGDELSSSVYPVIRGRLASALDAWHPADRSALPLLCVWKVWGPALTLFVQQHIVPKLELFLQQAATELTTGNYSSWECCVEWVELCGPIVLGALAARHVLPRWLATLTRTLNTNTQHTALLTSYIQFKKTFPEEVLKEPSVRDIFRKALDMMNRSADIDNNIEAPPPPRITEPKDMSRLAEVIASTNVQKSFSELLESKCIENGITFVPIAGKSREGRPVYKIGATMQCYVLRNVIMYSPDNGRTYLPISMDRLLKIAED